MAVRADATKQWHSVVTEFIRHNRDQEFDKYGRPATPLPPRFPDTMKRFAYFITYQAISARCCDSIWDQLVDLVEHLLLSLGADTYDAWPPGLVASIPPGELYGRAGVGLSRSKIKAIQGLARELASPSSPTSVALRDPTRSSSEVIRVVSSQIKGVGPFTVASFLIESGRLDIANYHDVVMRRGLMLHYELPRVPTVAQAARLTATWGAYKTVGTKYMFYVANRPPRMSEAECHAYELAARVRRARRART